MSAACESGDALDVRLVELHGDAEGDGAHQRDLVRGVHALDVEGGIRLGITELLGVGEGLGEIQALVAHFREDEIGGAVDDAGDPFDAVGGEPLAQRLDDRDAAGHRRLEGDHHAMFARRFENLGAVFGEQRLVGGDDMLARADRLQHQLARDAAAADQFHHDGDVRVGDDLAGVADDLRTVAHQGAGAFGVEVGDHRDLDAAAGAAADFLLVARQHLESAAANRANA